MNFQSYLEVGTVQINNGPPHSNEFVQVIGEIVAEQPQRKNRVGLAGPNDLLHILMPVSHWEMLLPWAKELASDLTTSVLGGYLVHQLLSAKANRKNDALEEKLSMLTEQLEKMQQAIRENEELDQMCDWDVRFGIRSADNIEEDSSRSTVGVRVANDSPRSAADAIIALSLIGPLLEHEIKAFHEAKSDESDVRRVSGVINISDDGELSTTLHFWSSKEGPVEPKTIRLSPAELA